MPRQSISSLFKPESATLQSGTILKPRVPWASKSLAEGLRHLVTEKQQIRDTQGPKSLEKLSHRSPGKTSRDRLIAEAITVQVTAKCRRQVSWAFTIRRSAELPQSANANLNRVPDPCKADDARQRLWLGKLDWNYISNRRSHSSYIDPDSQ
jgi:hypothetical protein